MHVRLEKICKSLIQFHRIGTIIRKRKKSEGLGDSKFNTAIMFLRELISILTNKTERRSAFFIIHTFSLIKDGISRKEIS